MTQSTFTEMMETCTHEILKGVCTSIPGHVLNFNPEKQLAQVQIGVQIVKADGGTVTPPPLILVPVLFPGGDFSIEHQLDKGNEGWVMFSQRCIDAWKDQGGVAPQTYRRYHDVNDAVFIPGIRSQKNKMASFENNGIRLRDKDGANYIWLKNDGTAEIQVTTLNLIGELLHTGNTTQTGNYVGTGTVTAPNVVGTVNVTFGGISGKDHVHQHGTPNTSGPQ